MNCIARATGGELPVAFLEFACALPFALGAVLKKGRWWRKMGNVTDIVAMVGCILQRLAI